MANKLFQAFIDTAKTIAGYPITVANAVFMRDGSTLDEFSENIPHREDDEDTNIEVPNIDADMLNGHPSDYYAKQSDLSALNTSVTQVNNKIGNTDVSKWGNSLTGAIKAACDKSDANETAIADVNSNLQKIGTDEFTDYVFDTTKYKLLVITFFEISIVNSYVTVVIPSIIGMQQASIVICGPVAGDNYVYNVVVKFQVKANGIELVFAKFDACSSSTIKRDLIIDRLESIVGIKK